MIFLKSPKSSEFANFFKQKSVTMFISSCFNNYLIEFLKIRKLKKLKVTPPTGFKPATPGFEATEHLRNSMRKENCRKRLYVFMLFQSTEMIKITTAYHWYKKKIAL